MDDAIRLVERKELLDIITDQADLNVRVLTALHAAAKFAANAGQASAQYWIFLASQIQEDDDRFDLDQLLENNKEMLAAIKDLLSANQEITERISNRNADIKQRMEAISEGLKKLR